MYATLPEIVFDAADNCVFDTAEPYIRHRQHFENGCNFDIYVTNSARSHIISDGDNRGCETFWGWLVDILPTGCG